MKSIYFITATNTDIGKTKACEIFLKKYALDGKKVGYFKPIETGVLDRPLDGGSMIDLVTQLNSNFPTSMEDIVPFQFTLPAAPYVANIDNIDINIDFLIEKVQYLLTFCDVLIIEGAGGLMVPIKQNYFMIDLIKEFQECFESQETILITPSKLGCINDTLLSQNILKQKGIDFKWYINLYQDKDEFKKTTLPFYKDYFDDELNYL